jgi:hypothetical protein
MVPQCVAARLVLFEATAILDCFFPRLPLASLGRLLNEMVVNHSTILLA